MSVFLALVVHVNQGYDIKRNMRIVLVFEPVKIWETNSDQ